MKKKTRCFIFILLLFGISFYFVEFGPYSSRAVAEYNGYGIFDMQEYNTRIVTDVLNRTDADCIRMENIYYAFDFLFILGFGLFQAYLPLILYPEKKKITEGSFVKQLIRSAPIPALICSGIGIARGFFDLIENGILLYVVNSFPSVNDGLITFCTYITEAKLFMIKLWILGFVAGVVYRIYWKIKNR